MAKSTTGSRTPRALGAGLDDCGQSKTFMTSPKTLTPRFSICVYCASRIGSGPDFAAAAVQIGTWIGRQRGRLVFGGGRAGLMGVLADAALAAGAPVVGVIPRALVEREHAHRGCTELRVVETMDERKRQMAERSDCFLALPGGIGTLEEFFETWSWYALGYHHKPLGLLNLNGYYDGLIRFLHDCVDHGLMNDRQMQLVRIDSDWRALLEKLRDARQTSPAS